MGVHLLLGFGACVIALAALFTSTTLTTLERERDRAADRLAATGSSSARDYEGLGGDASDLEGFATAPGVMDLEPVSCAATLRSFGEHLEGARLEVVAPDGTVVCSNPELPAGEVSPSAETWLAAVAGGEATRLAAGRDPVSGEPASTWVFPIPRPDGSYGAFGLVTYTNVPPPPIAEGAIDGTFVVLIDRAERFVLGATEQAPVAAGATLDAEHPLLETLPAGGDEITDADGTERIYVETPVEGTGWTLVTGVTTSSALADARSELQRVVIAAIVTVLVVVALGVTLHRRLGRPIRELGDAIASSRGGDRDARAGTGGPREIAAVADAYNHLADEQRALEDQLRHAALHDSLTGLPNRAHLEAVVTGHLLDPDAGPIALLFLDLDRFKLINDSHGHATGDKLLVALGERLRHSLDGEWLLSRFGGDEFVIVCPRSSIESSIAIAERVVRTVHTSIHIDGWEIYVGGSVGIAVASPGDTAADLIRNADTAMYRAKEHARGGWVVFDEAMRAWSIARLGVEHDLRGAQERGEMELHYQPKLSLENDEVIGMEALIRWNHPERGRVAPDSFIAVAEETGQIVPLGRWVLETAARQAAAWRRRLGTPLPVAVNVAARQLSTMSLAESITSALDEAGALPSDIIIEVTEGAVLVDMDVAIAQLEAIRAMGVRVSIDDFGTGYSSLSYLQRLPADELKIDRTFVADMLVDDSTRAIIRSVIDLGHAIGLDVVAEGVETAEQLTALRALGCDSAQGYHLGRPADVAATDALVVARLAASRPVATASSD